LPSRSLNEHFLQQVRRRLPVVAHVEGDDQFERLAVLGRNGTLDLTVEGLEVLERFGVGHRLGLIGLGDAAVADVDDDRGDGIGGGEVGLFLERGGRLGAARQPFDGVVLFDVGQLTGEASADGGEHQPDGEHDPFAEAPGQPPSE
jgi:hypothetical protein